MTDLSVFRVYEPQHCGPDGYPFAWSGLDHAWLLDWASSEGESVVPPAGRFGIKDVVRHEAGHRCVRCGHPYRCGESEPEWSPCDDACTHDGPIRVGAGDVWKEHALLSAGFEARDLVRIHAPLLHVEAAYRVLTVHHLDGDKRNCRWFNLAALDQRCHLEIQGKVRMHRPWPWEHSEWMRPYVAGFYAWKYGGEELSREQTMERLEELLALGRREEAVERLPV